MIQVQLRTVCGCSRLIRLWRLEEEVKMPIGVTPGQEICWRTFRLTREKAASEAGEVRVYVEVV